MKYKTLGNTGQLVSRLSLGTMTFAGQGFYKAIGTVNQPDLNCDEYILIVQVGYTLLINERRIQLNAGEEYSIPRGVRHMVVK